MIAFIVVAVILAIAVVYYFTREKYYPRIYRGPFGIGGIIDSQIVPDYSYVYGYPPESCQLCPDCSVCPICPQCNRSPQEKSI